MGQNHYRGSWGHGEIHDNPGAVEIMLNKPELQAILHVKAEEFVTIARGIFEGHSQHDPFPPVYYSTSFKVRGVRDGLVRGVRILNSDPTAVWVEFGAHAGGKTPVLRYRVFGRTADILEARR
jgi:hypothetical protein